MAIDINSISTVSESFSRVTSGLASTQTALTNLIPNTAGISVLGNAAGSLSNGVSGTLRQLQSAATPFVSAANNAQEFTSQLAQNIIAVQDRLGSTTSFLGSDFLKSSTIGSDFATAMKNVAAFNESFSNRVREASSKLPNPLRTHNHYNYIITLGILTIEEINNPATYRNSGGFRKIILRSGGGQYDIRQRVFIEGNEDAEYFIENLDIDALIAPNEKTGIALGTTVNFEVTEPYSMGKFIEALIAGAQSSGYTSFNNAPYCLKIEFVGWDEPGDRNVNYVSPPYYIPILITTVEFDVKEGGSQYIVQAVPYSEISLSNQIDTVHTELKTAGRFAHEVLENGELSVTSIINRSINAIEEKTVVSNFDRYMILFPKTSTTIMEALTSKVITSEGAKAVYDQRLALSRIRGLETRFGPGPAFFNDKISTNANSDVYQILKSLAVDTSKMNSIGNSEMDYTGMSISTKTLTPPKGIYDDGVFRVARRNVAAAQFNQKIKESTFAQGTRITEIIERTLVNTKYAREQAAKDLGEESPKFYRIETYTFIVDNPTVEKIIGRHPRIYVYAIHPYVSDQAHYLSANQKPKTTAQLRRESVKEYNYFYTGKNEDIIDFDIKYNYAFLQAVHADFGQLTGTERTKTQTDVTVAETTLDISPPTGGSSETKSNPSLVRVSRLSRDLPGSLSSDALGQLALNLHDMFINSNVDLINAEMKIWGDPYYLPSVLGNFSPGSKSSMLTEDERINYLTNDVTVIVNFLNPFDYEINGPLMEFGEDINPSFSGVYQVLSVTSQFQQGKFTQDIKMLRQRGQENTTEGSQKVLTVSGGKTINRPQPAASKNPTNADIVTTNPAATLTNTGQVVDNRTGTWANEVASTAGTVVSVAQSLQNPIIGLANLGKLLAGSTGTLNSILSNIKVNAPLSTPNTTSTPSTPPARTPVSGR